MAKKRRAKGEPAPDGGASDSDSSTGEELRAAALAAAHVAPDTAPDTLPTEHYDAEGIESAITDMKEDLHWLETLDVVAPDRIQLVDVDDDLARELAFYNQALASVNVCRERLEEHGIAHRRPDDFLAEMLKSDQHMTKVKERLMAEQRRMHAAEERRKARDARQFAKQVQAEKMKERVAEKKKSVAAVKEWQKQRASHGTGGGLARPIDEKDMSLERAISGGGGGGGGGRGGPSEKSKKRVGLDKKYGFGGRKRFAKSNDKKSTNDMSGYSGKRNSAPHPSAGKKTNAAAVRPGKRRRMGRK